MALVWGLILLFIIQPGIAHDGAVAGAQLFVRALLPYLLPYIILTQWLLKMPASSKKNPVWRRFVKAFILGSFGGFPVGAITVTEMTKNDELTNKQSALLLAVCHAPGPMFIIGFVGSELLGDVTTGWKLLIAIHLANIFFFVVMTFFFKSEREKSAISIPKIKKAEGMPLLEAIKGSSTIITLIATTVIFFSAIGTVLATVISSAFDVDTGIAQTIALSIFEMTTGVQSATDHFSQLPIFPFLIAAIISMNGLSIHMQVTVIAKAANISMIPYIFGRVWSVLTVPILFYIIF
ncbi:hypothetical protein [Sporosarcina sp. G11-34]|uniref:hypothetical protein n=1 Tax=Sporosarcina sp. G11-34 TaxID=2849605 RepID=UPI0022A94E00|nr:hypothetical protein [Sporosarcina sp. G11-34]MCZ2258892.1 hypothetical protein [Sporosarcina sp. G11-34]